MKFKFLWDEEEETSTKLKFTEPLKTQFGIGAKEEGGATLTTLPSQYKIKSLSLKEDYERKTLEQAGVSQRMRGIGEPPKKYGIEGITVELSKASGTLRSLWWSELKTTEDKGKFLKGESWSEELRQADIEVMKLSEQASKLGVNMKDWIEFGVYSTFFATVAVGILPILSGLPKNILNNLMYKVEGKTIKGKELLKVLQRVT
ncbi:MAG: hypothetical protein KAW56_16755, partial [Candidatus Marinimicrobia bacterium]|nr:hypothetical protein [Candidatus Neomarinimicrobiota bacterium]